MMPPAVHLALVVVLGLTATKLGPKSPTMVHAVPVEDTNTTREDNQCSPLQRRQDVLETRLNERESEVNTQLKELDTRLRTQLRSRHNEVNTRFDRMDDRLDGIETAISDMKVYLQARMEAMDKKVEWALTDIKPRQEVYTGCQDALRHGQTTSGVYTIMPEWGYSFNVSCDQQLDGGGWTVLQARQDGSVDFYRDWSSYKAGFGTLTGEFWLGNEKIHRLTKQQDQQLRMELVSREGEVQYADYDHFWIENEAHQYRLTVRGYTGGNPPGDAFTYHNGHGFSTKDRDNDPRSESCAIAYRGGWWYGKGCHYTNLNGVYGSTAHGRGLNWDKWTGYRVSLKAVRMLLRKKP